jgi:two-component system OmpR family response regulator
LPQHQQQPPQRVLCVEDNEDIRFMLATILKGAGYECVTVAAPPAASGLARSEHFDLFILDNKFDEGSGVELCRTLRANRPDTPVIFYSGAASDSDREAALSAGACAYVAKPGIEGLMRAVRRVLEAGDGLAGGGAEN